ncbi:hypothetical protein ACS0TY_011275 [Phlomoides rotata]
MKVSLKGEKMMLVPYMKEQVGRYHVWIQDQIIAIKPLTLDQEYEMQLSWVQDPLNGTLNILYYFFSAIGDVNIFINDPSDPQIAEVEIMIAEPKRVGGPE